MTTTTRPKLIAPEQRKPKRKQLYIVKLIAFKKNDHDLQLVIPAYSANEAWAYAQQQCWGYCYYIQSPQLFIGQQKSSPATGLPQT